MIKQEYKEISNKIAMEVNTLETEMLKELFTKYDADETIQKALEKAENGDYEDYAFDESGMLVGLVRIDLDDFPHIGEYIQQKDVIAYADKDLNCLTVCCGNPIVMDWNHDRHGYFIYDTELRKVIVKSRDNEKSEEYYNAKLEKHMREMGCFPDVVKVDSQGQYLKHVDTKLGNVKDEEIDAIIAKEEQTEE
jgi:hypothetical protein